MVGVLVRRIRRKRNVIDYDYAFVSTETEAKEILKEAMVFKTVVEQWISLENPSLAKSAPG
ncbi:MAG: hypothetical protein QOI53_3995 [Verrucomicrobiota bacterium]|jgi:hypothetical protein|nr:hypothetical protein [Alphaproteobacteria bacterium]MEA3148353.1 hypothetical protein [Verrucomicrobiota bacterium]